VKANGLIGALLVIGLSASTVQAYLFDWEDWRDASPPNTDFVINDNNVSGTDTATTGSNAYGQARFGMTAGSTPTAGFSSQTFTETTQDVNITLYYSDNHQDGNNIEGPDMYFGSGGSGTNPNPDRRVTGLTNLRFTNDRNSSGSSELTPVTLVLSYDKPVTFSEFIIGSLSTISGRHENVYVRAFSGEAATGSVVKATYLENISDLNRSDPVGADLEIDSLTEAGISGNRNELDNILVDSDLGAATTGTARVIGGAGVYNNVGTSGDDGIYHIIGEVPQGGSSTQGYGRVLFRWDEAPVQSIAVSLWASTTDDFNFNNVSNQWISTLLTPQAFQVIPEPSTYITGILLLGLLAGTIIRRHFIKAR
jgi:hypothetical protein